MAPGGEMIRYPQHFGENVLPRGSHEWLPYSVDAVRAEIVKHQFVNAQHIPKKRPPGQEAQGEPYSLFSSSGRFS